MEFEAPSNNGFTIYGKSGCPNCVKVKGLLKYKTVQFNIVDCDEYIIEENDKAQFLSFIKSKARRECKSFPMVFFNGSFIGGYTETKKYIEEKYVSFEESLSF